MTTSKATSKKEPAAAAVEYRDRIRLLPSKLRSKLLNELDIGCVLDVVLGLVENSLDARSTCIAVRISFDAAAQSTGQNHNRHDNKRRQIGVHVIDNGHGIPWDSAHLLGQRYNTSKQSGISSDGNEAGISGVDKDKFGYRGQMLAALGSMCKKCTIETRYYDNNGASWSKSFIRTKLKPAVISNTFRKCPGTSVKVTGLFYNLPVRLKSINPDVDMECLVNHLTAIAICYPHVGLSGGHRTSFTLRDEREGRVLLRALKCSSMLNTFDRLFSSLYPYQLYPLPKLFVYVNGFVVLQSWLQQFVTQLMKHTIVVQPKKNKSAKSKRTFGTSAQDSFLFPVPDFTIRSVKTAFTVFIIRIRCQRTQFEINRKVSIAPDTAMDKTSGGQQQNLSSGGFMLKDQIILENSEALKTLLRRVINRFIRCQELHLPENERKTALNPTHSEAAASATKQLMDPIFRDPNVVVSHKATVSDISEVVKEGLRAPLKETVEHIMEWQASAEEIVSGRFEKPPDSPMPPHLLPANLRRKERDKVQITVSLIKSLEVIGQFNESFVIGKGIGNRLFIVDQHAAHERVMLEREFKDNVSATGWKSEELTDTLCVPKLSESDVRIIQSKNKCGVVLAATVDEESGCDKLIRVRRVPRCLLEKEGRDFKRDHGRSQLVIDLRILLVQFAQIMKSTKGNFGSLPFLRDTMNMLACKKAIKFNQKLSRNEMSLLLAELSECDKPFTCAHGRPTVRPLF